MLAKLRAEGLIAMTDYRVRLLDPDALELLGHFQPLNLARIPAYRG